VDDGQPIGAEQCSWPRADLCNGRRAASFPRGSERRVSAAAAASHPIGRLFPVAIGAGETPVVIDLVARGRPAGGARRAGRGAPVAESAVDPPGPIPNPVVTHRSAGEYSGGDPMGGEAAAGAPRAGPTRAAGGTPARDDR